MVIVRSLRLLATALALLAVPCFLPAALAQDYPAKPVKLLVGFAAGGPTDVIARVLAQDMTISLGQAVIVENKTGANALIATQEVKRAAHDGYSILMTTLSHNVNAILMADKKPYDPLKDFATVSLVCFLPLVMVTGPDSPFNSVDDVVNGARAQPGEVSYASAGNGGSAHLAAALLETLTQTKMTHVPFRGNAPALTEVMGGRVSFMFYPMVGIADRVAQRRLKALAVSTEKSHPDYPGVPTMRDAGFPGFEDYTQGLGIVAPAGTPEPIIARLNQAIRTSLAKPETKDKLKTLGAVTEGGSSPEQFRGWLAEDAQRWERVINAAGVKAE
jgi:tripartite-type tricarboxylate transporter receptor subunit TctC